MRSAKPRLFAYTGFEATLHQYYQQFTFRNACKQEIDTIRNLPFFFILGRPRSGTTLLRTILDAHPNIVIPPENSYLIHLYFKYRHAGVKWESEIVLNSTDV